MIHIKETETEYLLFIPPSQKERARAIQGRRWDAERKCWVFPRTNRMYDILIAEFGDDMSPIYITRPSHRFDKNGQTPTDARSRQTLQEENRNLREDIARIYQTLEVIKHSNNHSDAAEIQN
ncbi:hypothetical protein [Kallotenue papyrolyticum]|uniref:hypothetical protein n=1 Tax=Kallotenue papyrolyticum TaxID=1325125 RepID=UPI0012683C3D|nr:hypothetical protein [Kallotenue papyrolyticum]